MIQSSPPPPFLGGQLCLIDSQYSYQCYNLLSLFLPKGIFPASYIHLKEAIVEGKGESGLDVFK